MLAFPNCKINLGLNVLSKRADHFHNLATVFYPINWCDAIELLPGSEKGEKFELKQHGFNSDFKTEDNLLYKAWRKLSEYRSIPAIRAYLLKNIPMGAGLGGGSSDAAFFIQLLNRYFGLNLSLNQQCEIASTLGSDCAFFIHNRPMYAEGKGDELSPIKLDLSAYYILLLYPNIHISTAEAYSGVKPKGSEINLKKTLESQPIESWKHLVVNDFEEHLFTKYPLLEDLKSLMYKQGAIYAAMSGSGSTIYGIYKEKPELRLFNSYRCYLQNPCTTLL